jgi:hypothetical protein
MRVALTRRRERGTLQQPRANAQPPARIALLHEPDLGALPIDSDGYALQAELACGGSKARDRLATAGIATPLVVGCPSG